MRARGQQRDSAMTAARPASAALIRSRARWRGSRARRRCRAARATPTIARPIGVVSSRRTAPRRAAASARPNGRSGTTSAEKRACAVSARSSASTCGARRAPRERTQQRRQVAAGTTLQREAAAAKRARSPGAAASAARCPRPPRRAAPRRANASPARPPAAAAARSARTAVRPAPSSAATRRARRAAALERALARGRPRSAAPHARPAARCGAERVAARSERGDQRASSAALTRARSRRSAPRRGRGSSCQPPSSPLTPWTSRRAGARRRCGAIWTTTSIAVATCSRTTRAAARRLPAARASRAAAAHLRALRVHRRQRAVVPGVHRLQHVERLAAAHLAHDQPVGPHPQRVADELADRDVAAALEARGTRLEPHDVRPVDAELGRVLDRDDPLGRVDEPRERAEQRRLARGRAAADHESRPRAHAACEQLPPRPRVSDPALDELRQGERARREAPERQQRPVGRDRRQHDVEPRAVGETGIDHRRASSMRRPAEARAARTRRAAPRRRRSARCALQAPAALDPDLLRPVDEHLVDARVGEQRRERIGSGRTSGQPAPRTRRRQGCARSQSLIARAPATAASRPRTAAGRRRPRSRAVTPRSGLTAASSGSPASLASACAAARMAGP